MLGWKCKIGYIPNSAGSLDLASTVFTDDGVWVLPELPQPNEYKQEYDDIYELGETLANYLGDEYYYLYAYAFTGMNDSGISRINSIVPSAIKMAPNLFNYCKDNYISINRFVIYIQSIKRAILISRQVTGSSEAYIVSPNGRFTKIGDTSNNQIGLGSHADLSQRITRAGFIGIFRGKRSLDDLKNPQNYGNVQFAFPFTPHPFWQVRISNENQGAEAYASFWSDYVEPDVDTPENPYEPGGPSGPGTLPPGTFDDESDPIPDSDLPTLSAANTGFTRIYNPTLSQVQSLARYLWTDPDVIQTIWNHIKQFFENPMEAIIGFNLVPVPVPDGGTENFALMYIDTGVQMTVAANQFVDLDCGTVELKRYYGSALDQSPYTKVSCYLPYIGTVNLNTDEVMGATLQVKYRVDIVSGSCVAKIFVDGNCLYQYSGHCAITIPISSADFSSYVSAAISVGKLAGAALIGGAGAPAAIAAAEAAQQTGAVTTIETVETARNPSTGRQITTGTTTQTITAHQQPKSITKASFAGLSPQNITNTVGGVMSSKPHIEHSGSFSGNSGYLGVRRPFLIIERPNMCMPANYQTLNGFPSMITMELSTCKGFTRVQQVQLTGMGRATNPEQAEILELLKSGVIL